MILVDNPVWPGKGRAAGRMWAHLVSDVSYDELHAFAGRLGLPARGFDRDHYDIPAALVPAALSLGAMHLSSRDLVSRLSRSGLRRRKHEAR
jgi:Protein of unknown function (DUF4031)